ncbi:hypothetical protein K7432_002025 [Basidiobolus ranarum]|uniref:5-hmdU DNA kinase helical domain-containing protein n=1 Tax=Basidiobolus ranarum TaxID=34480 RepID=A0ABR2X246_9FUNG
MKAATDSEYVISHSQSFLDVTICTTEKSPSDYSSSHRVNQKPPNKGLEPYVEILVRTKRSSPTEVLAHLNEVNQASQEYSLIPRILSQLGYLDVLLYFVSERHHIYHLKQDGISWPWTADPFLRNYHFTNIFRELDVVSQIIYDILSPHCPLEPRFFSNVIIHRLISRKEINLEIGFIENFEEAWRAIEQRRRKGTKFATAAFQSCSHFQTRKMIWQQAWSHGEYVWSRYCSNIPLHIPWVHSKQSGNLPTIEMVYRGLMVQPKIQGLGKFLAWQVACDTHMLGLSQDVDLETPFVALGPGAQSGLDILNLSFVEVLKFLNENRPPHVPTLYAKDIEHTLCEFHKYIQIRRGNHRYRRKYTQYKDTSG